MQASDTVTRGSFSTGADFACLLFVLYRLHKKVDKSVITLCFAKRLDVRWFFIKIDCLSTYNPE